MKFSNISPSHELHFLTNSSGMGPFHGVQSLRNELLQQGSPVGSKVLPANLLQCGLLFPWIHRFFQKSARVWSSNRVTASFRHPPALVGVSCMLPHVPPWAAGAQMLHHGLHHLLQGNLWHPEHFPPFLLH